MKVVAVVCGAVCALCVAAFMYSVQLSADAARAEALERYGGAQTDVYVAKRDIAAGERVEASMIEVKSWVSELLPEGAIRSTSSPVGQVASSSVCAGEVLLEKRFEATGGQLEVPAGTTALSVPAKTVQAVGGSLAPGMYVDVYSTGDTKTSAIAEDVLVLAASASNSSSSSWVTIAVEEKLVQQMVAAANATELYFVLPSGASSEEDEPEGSEK